MPIPRVDYRCSWRGCSGVGTAWSEALSSWQGPGGCDGSARPPLRPIGTARSGPALPPPSSSTTICSDYKRRATPFPASTHAATNPRQRGASTATTTAIARITPGAAHPGSLQQTFTRVRRACRRHSGIAPAPIQCLASLSMTRSPQGAIRVSRASHATPAPSRSFMRDLESHSTICRFRFSIRRRLLHE